MVRAADFASKGLHFRSQAFNDGLIDAHGEYPSSFLANPVGRVASFSGGSSSHHRPPYHPHLFRQAECYGSYNSRDPFVRRPPDQYCDRGLSLSASLSPPPSDRRAEDCVDAPIVRPAYVPPPACHRSPGTSSKRPLGSRRGFDISPVPSTPTRSPRRERYREQHHRARDESSRSPRLHVPPRGSKSLPSSKPYRSEDRRKGSKSLPSSKRYRMDEGRHASSNTAHWYDDNERGASRDRHGNDGSAQDWPHCACDGSDVAGREPNVKHEDPIHMKTNEDSAYGALVDDFMDAVLKNWREPVSPDLTSDKEAYQKQTNRFAELALKRYNKDKNNKVKYSLDEALVGAAIFEDSELYAHVNFYANAKNGPKKNGPRELIFAELHKVGPRPNAMALTSFHLVDEGKQFPGCRDQVRSCRTTEDEDVYHCYACSDKIKHPKGVLYKAGHITDTLYYLND